MILKLIFLILRQIKNFTTINFIFNFEIISAFKLRPPTAINHMFSNTPITD